MIELAFTIFAAVTTQCATEHHMNCHYVSDGTYTSFISIERADGSELVLWDDLTWRVFP